MINLFYKFNLVAIETTRLSLARLLNDDASPPEVTVAEVHDHT